MSNLQVLARRCPIMGKAMAVQSSRAGNSALTGAFGGVRAYGGKAKLHTTRAREATVGAGVFRRPDDGMHTSVIASRVALRESVTLPLNRVERAG